MTNLKWYSPGQLNLPMNLSMNLSMNLPELVNWQQDYMCGESRQNAGDFVQPVQISRVHIVTQATLLMLACYGFLRVGFFEPVTIKWGFDTTPRNTAPALIGFLPIPLTCLFVGKMVEIGADRTKGSERRFLGVIFVFVAILPLARQILIVVSATGG